MHLAKTGILIVAFLFALNVSASAQNLSHNQSHAAISPAEQDAATELFKAANEDRAPEGLQSLKQDPALADAAWQHAQRMVQSGTLTHQLPGEPDLIVRVQQAGVHCSTVAENIAAGPSAGRINDEWMHSESHRANLLDPRVNAVGIAVVQQNGRLFAVEDFAREMTALTKPQQEQQVTSLLKSRGLQVEQSDLPARNYCGNAMARTQQQPKLVMKYSTTDLSHLPQKAEQGITSGDYRRAVVAACSPANQNGFSAYQIVILLY